ncbi:MAG: hypothetical protein JXQ74_01010 [Alphaproteobacteria bacterium]|nr:hypothetical protein [Alphaproteobacteria bacterium]
MILRNGFCVFFILLSLPAFGQGFLDNFYPTKEESDTKAAPFGLDAAPIVQAFDIAGVSLEATYPYLKSQIFPKSGYTIIETENKIPILYRYNYNYSCRQKGAKTPDAIDGCIIGMAQKAQMEYIERIKLKRFKTGEEIEIWFTSPLTDHLVYKVIYRNDVDEVEGLGPAYHYQQNEKRRQFWNDVIFKYKRPNIPDEAIWGDPTDSKKPFLQAYYGKLKLEYPALYEKDKATIATTAEERFQSKEYKF